MEKELLNENQRRIVLKALGLFPLAAGSVLLQSGLSGCSTTTEPSGNNVDLKVSEESALNNIDGFLRRTYGSNNNGDPIIIIKTFEGVYRCISASCPKNCEKKPKAPELGNPSTKQIICETCPMKATYSTDETSFGNVISGQPSQTLREIPSSYNPTTGILTIKF